MNYPYREYYKRGLAWLEINITITQLDQCLHAIGQGKKVILAIAKILGKPLARKGKAIRVTKEAYIDDYTIKYIASRRYNRIKGSNHQSMSIEEE
jgi:hypothetical protein